MARHRVTRYILLVLIIISYLSLVIYSIGSNKAALQKDNYWNWYRAYVTQAEHGTFVNTGTQEKPVALSESQGYGMLITVLAAQKGYIKEDQFMRLFHYYKANRISVENPLMKWRQEKTDSGWISHDKNNATDGDLDIAYALIQAEKIWPQSTEKYGEAAILLLNAIKSYNYSQTTGLLTVGNWATVDAKAEKIIRTSDIIPSYFKAFATYTKDPFWTQLEANSIDALEKMSQANQTGLLPDFAWVTGQTITPAKPYEVADKNDGYYAYNATRVPLRLADSNQPKVKAILNKLLTFFQKQPVVYDGYTLKGKPLVKTQSQSFSAPILYASNKKNNFSTLYASQRWVFDNKITGEDYYGDTLKTLVLLKLY